MSHEGAADRLFQHPAKPSLAPAPERLLPPWLIALFAIGVGVVLILLSPKERLLEQLAHAGKPTTITVVFLENLLKTELADEDLRMLLADHQLELGKIQETRDTLEPLFASKDPDLKVKALLIDLRLTEAMVFAQDEGTPERQEGMARIGSIIKALLDEPMDNSLLPSLADSALLGGHQALAQSVYVHLGKQGGEQAYDWYHKAADLVLGQGRYAQAAEFYFAAQTHAPTLESQRQYFLKALKAFQAGDLLAEALAQADAHLGPLIQDDTTLLFLVSLGRSAGDGAFAQKYIKELLRVSRGSLVGYSAGIVQTPLAWGSGLRRSEFSVYTAVWRGGGCQAQGIFPSMRGLILWVAVNSTAQQNETPTSSTSPNFRPFDDRIYTLAIKVFLENGNLSEAYRVAGRAVQQVPDNLVWRRLLAQVGEWVGRRTVALEQWRYIAEKDPRREAFEQILRLLPGTYDDESLVFALQGLAKQVRWKGEEWHQLADAYERIGRPAQAIAELMRMNEERPDPALLEHAALLCQRMGLGNAARALYEQLEHTYGPTLPWGISKATLHYQQGELVRAYQVLMEVKFLASESDTGYWKLVGQLAWSLQKDAEVEQAYRILWQQEEISQVTHERLIQLVRQSNSAEAVEMGLEGWVTYQDPKFFILPRTF